MPLSAEGIRPCGTEPCRWQGAAESKWSPLPSGMPAAMRISGHTQTASMFCLCILPHSAHGAITKQHRLGALNNRRVFLRVPRGKRSGAGDSASEGALGCRHLLLLVSACGTKRVLVSLVFLIRTLI